MNNEEKILAILAEMQTDLADVKSEQKNQGDRLDRIEAKLEDHSDRLDRIEAKLEDHSDRLDRIEAKQEEQGDRLRKVELMMENKVLPSLQLLAEGQKTLLDTLAPKTRVEELEDEVSLLKTVIKALSQRVSLLEKAQ